MTAALSTVTRCTASRNVTRSCPVAVDVEVSQIERAPQRRPARRPSSATGSRETAVPERGERDLRAEPWTRPCTITSAPQGEPSSAETIAATSLE